MTSTSCPQGELLLMTFTLPPDEDGKKTQSPK
jgi:hypothetical protein